MQLLEILSILYKVQNFKSYIEFDKKKLYNFLIQLYIVNTNKLRTHAETKSKKNIIKMSLPSLQTITLAQYIKIQDTENDPISESVRADYSQIADEVRNVKYFSMEYQNYVQARESFEHAQYIWQEFEKKINEEQKEHEDYVDHVAMEERNEMLNMVDPNHENFNQCACGRLLKRDNMYNCWVSNCEQNQSVCKHCFKHKDGHARNCRFCELPSCSTEHHLEHLKQCKKHVKNNICGFGEFWTNASRNNHYEKREDLSESDKKLFCWGLIVKDSEFYCNKISSNLTKCNNCSIKFCPECDGGSADKRVRYYDIGGWSWETHNFCKSEECQDELESLFTSSQWDHDEYPESQEIF